MTRGLESIRQGAGPLTWAMLLLCVSWWLAASPAMATETRVLVVPKAESTPFWHAVERGAMVAGAERGVHIIFRGPLALEEIKAQQGILEAGVTDGVDAIVIAPSHITRLAGVLNRARGAGIVVVVIDSPLRGVDYSSLIATDNQAAGQEAGEYLLKLTSPGDPILMLRHVDGNESTLEREHGFSETVKTHGRDNRLLVSPFVGVSLGNAYHRILALLKEHPEVRGVFASGAVNTMACIQVLEELGLAGKVRMVGFDDEPEIRQALRDKVIDGVMIQQPYRMGYLGVTTACDVLDGKRVPGRIVTKARLYTEGDALPQLME